MKSLQLSLASALCLLAAPLASAALMWDFEGASGSGPYFVNTPVDSPFQASSRLTAPPRAGVTASIASGATSPASGDYLLLQASSQVINDSELVFTLDASGPVAINSLSYNAVVFMPNQGPTAMTWTYAIDYGGGAIGPQSLLVDDYGNNADWHSYNPDFNIVTVAPATISIFGTLGGANTFDNQNGNVGFDDFSFDVTDLSGIPEPSPVAIFGAGLALVAATATRFRRNRSGERC